MSGNMITANYDLEGKQTFDPAQNPESLFECRSATIKTVVVLTQAAYDALAVKDANTEYNIVA